jgi:hypothetical protein
LDRALDRVTDAEQAEDGEMGVGVCVAGRSRCTDGFRLSVTAIMVAGRDLTGLGPAPSV